MENAELSLQLRSMQNEGCMMKDEKIMYNDDKNIEGYRMKGRNM